jgi:hypothetical protein
MVIDSIKNLFCKKYFVFSDLKLEVNKNIATDFQNNFDELIIISNIMGYRIEKENKVGYVILFFYCEKNGLLFTLYFDIYKNKIINIRVRLPQKEMFHYFYQNKFKYSDLCFKVNYSSEKMIDILKLLKEMILER